MQWSQSRGITGGLVEDVFALTWLNNCHFRHLSDVGDGHHVRLGDHDGDGTQLFLPGSHADERPWVGANVSPFIHCIEVTKLPSAAAYFHTRYEIPLAGNLRFPGLAYKEFREKTDGGGIAAVLSWEASIQFESLIGPTSALLLCSQTLKQKQTMALELALSLPELYKGLGNMKNSRY